MTKYEYLLGTNFKDIDPKVFESLEGDPRLASCAFEGDIKINIWFHGIKTTISSEFWYNNHIPIFRFNYDGAYVYLEFDLAKARYDKFSKILEELEILWEKYSWQAILTSEYMKDMEPDVLRSFYQFIIGSSYNKYNLSWIFTKLVKNFDHLKKFPENFKELLTLQYIDDNAF